MDDGSLAALRQSVEAALDDARRALARRHDALAAARADLDRAAGAEASAREGHARWRDDLRALSGHTLSSEELRARRLRGDALAVRSAVASQSRESARAAIEDAERAVEAGRQAVGELLARQRWVESEARRGREARARQAEARDDEE